MADLTQFNDADLDHLSTGNLPGMSNEGLALLEAMHQAKVDAVPSGPDTTSAAGRFAHGLADPFEAVSQLIERSAPDGQGATRKPLPPRVSNAYTQGLPLGAPTPAGGIDKMVRDKEVAYQKSRGDEGGNFDVWRAAGNVLNPATMLAGAAVPSMAGLGWLSRALVSGGIGGVTAPLMTPVTNDTPDTFWSDKGDQAKTGAVAGAALSPLATVAERLISPRASTNPQLRLLTDEGVTPSIGQALGGYANKLEQQGTSLPWVGDRIAAARNRGQNTFENAFINRSQSPIGTRVQGSGHDAIADAHRNVTQALDNAENAIGGMHLDQGFQQAHMDLTDMVQSLTPANQRRFNQVYQDHVLGKTTPTHAGDTLLGPTYADALSNLGTLADTAMKNPMVESQNYGSALRQLRQNLIDSGYRQNPQAQALHQQAREAYANLMRVEDAVRAAGNNEGHFTPAQANNAVKSGRGPKTAFAQGTALGQDLTNAGQTVLGNRVPDSGTAGRALLAMLHPGAIPGMIAGGLAYSPGMQRAMVNAVTRRPDIAAPVAGALAGAIPRLAAGAGASSTALSQLFEDE